tara:strand:- start:3336 stop:4778 length:1443 start_codon:yes stop_codon:yes gene_type:complete
MKYLNIITRPLVFTILFASSALVSEAQLNTISPYSRFGLGELESQTPSYGHGLSGSMVALSTPFSVNFTNPASYSSIARPVFQTGLTVKSFQLENAETSERNSLSKINEMSIGIPLGKGFGAAFGVFPFSSVGYELSENSSILPDGTSAEYRYSGNGGYTKGFLGTSYKKNYFKDFVVKTAKGLEVDTIKYLNSYLSIGVNGNLLFGSSDYGRDVIYDELSGIYHRKEIRTVSMGDGNLTFGALFKKNLRIKHEYRRGESVKTSDWGVTAGLSYSLENNIGFTSENLIQNANYSSSLNELSAQDTIFYSGEVDGEIILPAELRAGLVLSFVNEKERQLELSMEWKNQNWENYANSLEDMASAERYGNANSYSLGMLLTPRPAGSSNTPWYMTTIYQVGVRHGDGYLKFSDEALTVKRVSLGVSIPFLGSNSYSRLNLGMDFGTWGSTDNGLIKETSLSSYIGISIMPHKNDKWFVKSKYR